jgi:hypothetical protein
MLNIEDREEDEVIVNSVEVVKVLFFNWSADLVFMLIDEACSVASSLNMIINHALMTSKSRTSWMSLWDRQ